MKRVFLFICFFILVTGVQAQKKKKVVEKFPATMEAFVDFDKGSAYYTKEGLDMLDSIYMIAFNKDNKRFYKMTITGYDDGDEVSEQSTTLARDRAVMVFKYFSSREETEYIIKRTPSYQISSCSGQQEYYIKYKMPFDFHWINIANVPKEILPDGVDCRSKVHVLVEEDQEDCLGSFFDYDFPSQDTVMRGNYTVVTIPKGAIEYIHHTKDTLQKDYSIEFKDVMGFDELADNYFLVPHNKQYIINAGYIVIKPSVKPDYATCEGKDTIQPNIDIRVFMDKHQYNSGLKFYGKTYKPNGDVVYKAISTKKIKDKERDEMWIQCLITPFQFDTVFVGKKIEEKDMSDYFYAGRSEEPGSFECMDGWLKCYKLDKQGKYILKDKMQGILRKPR
ncbi:MAG: hypothetical protein IJ681_05470 [Bacteroidales bacterium]|nr:hypothetical protein [Bacteroidales bacterium]